MIGVKGSSNPGAALCPYLPTCVCADPMSHHDRMNRKKRTRLELQGSESLLHNTLKAQMHATDVAVRPDPSSAKGTLRRKGGRRETKVRRKERNKGGGRRVGCRGRGHEREPQAKKRTHLTIRLKSLRRHSVFHTPTPQGQTDRRHVRPLEVDHAFCDKVFSPAPGMQESLDAFLRGSQGVRIRVDERGLGMEPRVAIGVGDGRKGPFVDITAVACLSSVLSAGIHQIRS